MCVLILFYVAADTIKSTGCYICYKMLNNRTHYLLNVYSSHFNDKIAKANLRADLRVKEE